MKFIVVLFLFLSSCVYKDEEPDEHISWKKKRMSVAIVYAI